MQLTVIMSVAPILCPTSSGPACNMFHTLFNAIVFTPQKSIVTFKDVGGIEHCIQVGFYELPLYVYTIECKLLQTTHTHVCTHTQHTHSTHKFSI